SFLAE
ncbi:hypothetical protein VCHC17A1_2276B, partial [Vibrio cholerae HC-17A1]